jgi:large subunit ribosomal protein L10
MSAQVKRIRPEKRSVVNELQARHPAGGFFILADYTGLNSGATLELRRRLRGAQARVQVVPNRLFKKALGGDRAKTHQAALEGPTAVIRGEGDVVETAKTLADFSKEFKRLVVKGGEMDGRVLSAADVIALAALPPRPVLLGQFLGTLVAPMSGLVGVLQQKLASVVYVLKAAADRKAAPGA